MWLVNLFCRYGYDKWSKWDVLHLVRFLLQHGAKNSINQAGNSALACVFRHIRDMEVCFELLSMLIKEDGKPCLGFNFNLNSKYFPFVFKR